MGLKSEPSSLRQLIGWIPAGLWGAGIFVLSSIPGPKFPRVHLSDKLAHGVLYAGFGGLIAMAMRRGSRARMLLGASMIAASYGVTDEVHQMFVANRTPELGDIAADGVGAVLGAVVATAMVVIVDRRKRPSATSLGDRA